ncbi:hypothetical protein BTVI_80420 [Pitangus sulphuratus]|nr:hypothetical protein BTVI_80420 [Pitangus sulphuratus]
MSSAAGRPSEGWPDMKAETWKGSPFERAAGLQSNKATISEMFDVGMGKSPVARCQESGLLGLRSTPGCVMGQGRKDNKMYLSHDPKARISVKECPFECPLHPFSFLSPLFKFRHLKQKIHTMPLASLCTDHTLGLVARAQKDYSQSLELPKRPSTAEQQEWFPGSCEDVSARTAMALAAGHV